MRIVTNPGSNLDEDMTHRLDVDLVPQKIVVDGISHDTRNTIDFGQVDRWVKTSLKPAFVQGTTEPEFIEYFTRLIQRTKDPELLVVMTSRKLIGSHDAAVAAVGKLKDHADPLVRGAKIEIVDTLVTDIGAGLTTLAAVQARKAGLDLKACATFLRKFVDGSRNALGLAVLDNMIRGGKVSGLQGFVANFLNIRPLLSVVDGTVQSVAKISSKADMVQKLDEYLRDRLDKSSPLWVGIAHGNAPDRANALATRLKESYRCEYVLVRPLSTSIYLHMGPGSVGVFAYPISSTLPFKPPAPS